MAHLVETMMSANAVVPWHKLGNVISGYPTIDDAYTQSGLDWVVSKVPLFTANGTQVSYFGIERSSDNEILGVCTDRYQLFQNKEAFDQTQQFFVQI